MKKLMIFILFVTNLSAQLKPTDVIDFDNFNYAFAEKLLHEKFNEELDKLIPNHKPFVRDSVACKAMDYQLNHFKNGGELSHDNSQKFKNVLLRECTDRLEYFSNKKSKIDKAIEVLCYITRPLIKRNTNKIYYTIDSVNNFGTKEYIFRKTEKKDDNKTYYEYDSLKNSYRHTMYYDYDSLKNSYHYTNYDSNLYQDMITYEYIVNEITTILLIKSKGHAIAIKLAYELGLSCFWKIEFKKIDNQIKLWSGCVFY